MVWNPRSYSYISIKTDPETSTNTLAYINEALSHFAPGVPMETEYLSDVYDTLYVKENNLMHLLIVFSLLTIIIAVAGVTGIVTFITEQRKKEISIRRCLNASIRSLILLLSRKYILIVAAANLIGVPIVLIMGFRWLSRFAYQTTIPVGIFLLSGLITMGVTGLITILITGKAAYTNPVQYLRN